MESNSFPCNVDETGLTTDEPLESPQHISSGNTRVNIENNAPKENKKKGGITDARKTSGKGEKLRVLHLHNVPIRNNYESINDLFCNYGKIEEIRMNLINNKWEVWISFFKSEDAFKACCNLKELVIDGTKIDGALADKVPQNMDIYRPQDWSSNDQNSNGGEISRTPKPPRWILINGKDCFNFFKVSKFIQRRVGLISSKDIYRFNRKSILVHAKSDTQSHMLLNLPIRENEMVREVKPHFSFSYGKGVIFDEDLYEFSEAEILDMCPSSVWKIKKVPRTSMMILTFEDPDIPSHIYIENVRINVRTYKQRPLQCYRCFKFGHPSDACRNEQKICMNCSAPEHGLCDREVKCVNCNEDHKPNSKNCEEFRKEAEAIMKAATDHISIGAAKKILNKQLNFARAVKAQSNPPIPPVNTTPIPKPTMSVEIINGSNTGTKPKNTRKPNPPFERSLSQDELPDLGLTHPTIKGKNSNNQLQKKKRERPPSSSPPSSPKIQISNRFDNLDTDDDQYTDTQLYQGKEKPFNKKAVVEVHHHPRPENINKNKPNINRNPARSKSQKKKDDLLLNCK